MTSVNDYITKKKFGTLLATLVAVPLTGVAQYAILKGNTAVALTITCVTLLLSLQILKLEIETTGLPKGDAKSFLKRAAIYLASIFILAVVATAIAKAAGVPPAEAQNQTAIKLLFQKQSLTMLIQIILIAPVVEEVLTRKLIPAAVMNFFPKENTVEEWHFSKIMGLALGNMVFISAHSPTNLREVLLYAGMSFVFTVVTLKEKTVVASIWTHMLWNTIAAIPILIQLIK